MKKKKEMLVLGKMLQKIAPKIGATIVLEPTWGIVGQITFKDGRRSYFRYNTLDLNPVGSSEVARDKDYANFFIKKLGYPVVPNSRTFFSEDWARAIHCRRRGIDAAFCHARKIGFPVIVKPNSGSQGVGVTLVHNKTEFYRAMRFIFKRDRVGLVQSQVIGKDYRVVVLDQKIISAYERIPLNVIGDGKSTIIQLLRKKQRQFIASSRDTNIKMNDPRIKEKIRRQGLSFETVPAKNQQIFLLDNANLSSGGSSIDVTKKVHPDFQKIAIAITKEMGLRLCGVDLIIQGDISQAPRTFFVIEINSAPGLDHYVQMGRAQEKIVEDLYLQVLKHINLTH